MLIASDIDAVLGDFLSMYLKYRNDTYNTNWQRDQFYTYVWSEVFQESKEQMYSILSDFFHSDYINAIEPMPGAVEGIERIGKKNKILVVTSRPRLIADATYDWLNKYFPDKFEKVFFSNQPSYGSFGSTKGEICKQVRADMFIDDQFHYCDECNDEGVESLLYDNPWNQGVDLPKHITRVKNWGEIVKIVANKNK